MSTRGTPTADEIFGGEPAAYVSDGAPRTFERLDGDGYRLALPSLGLSFELTHIRREHGALVGELIVRADLAGARTVDGVLSAADFSVSSLRARQERARYLASRAQADDVDWPGLLEELCLRVLAAERAGEPAVSLDTVPIADDAPAQALVDGLPLLLRHAQILFGPGGAGKSLVALHVAAQLARGGLRVLYADWELIAEDHARRLRSLCGHDLPAIRYVRCAQPITEELPRLRRLVRDEGIGFVVCDSVGFAAAAPPETAEAALTYFRAVRQLGEIGSLHLAHQSKAEDGDRLPYGSVFWANSARAVWYLRAADPVEPGAHVVAAFPRKCNLGALPSAVGWEFRFGGERIEVRRADVTDSPDLAVRLPLAARIRALLRHGAMTREALAEELGVSRDTLRQALYRAAGRGQVVAFRGPDGVERVGLPAPGGVTPVT